MVERRRPGDHRPYRHWRGVPLAWRPVDAPFRWLPRHGEPSCVGEWLSQNLLRVIAYLPIYTALIATLTLIVVVVTR